MSLARRTFPKTRGLRGRLVFKEIRETGKRKSSGPLIVWAVENGLKFSRIGIGLNRAAGNAVARNRIKRMIREAFRLHQRELPAGFDFVVSAKAHEPMKFAEYSQRLLTLLAGATQK